MGHKGEMAALRNANLVRRWLTILLTIAAWFALSNHCALGVNAALADAAPKMSGCPMHSAPTKKSPAPQTTCCKDVRAVLAKRVGATEPGSRLTCPAVEAPRIFRPSLLVAIAIKGLDTGPPGRVTFAELVLQESLLAHAPPVS
jgi:hypothetical protein